MSSDEAEDDKEEASELTLLTIADSGGSTNFRQPSPGSNKNEKDFDRQSIEERKSEDANSEIFSECSDFPDDEATKEFKTAFGFATQQVHEKNADDDQVDR